MNIGITGNICSHFKGKCYEQFEWKVERFSSLVDSPLSRITSPKFPFNHKMWYIQLYRINLERRYCALLHNSTNIAPPMFIHFTFGVKKEDECIEQWFSSSSLFTTPENRWGTHNDVAASEFSLRKSELVPSDCLNIIIILSLKKPQLIKYEFGQSFQLKFDDDEKKPDMTGSGKVLSDILELFDSGNISDVVICVQGIEFKAHSAILAARIPVMCAMFKHETLEKASSRINITDCEPNIFKEFLYYIYSGTIRNCTFGNIYGLYQVSNKYLVSDLKTMCRKHIHYNLRVETFCDTIKLAVMYEDEYLLQIAFRYFTKHFRLIIRSVEWLNYLKENPIQANEFFIKSFGPP